MKVKAIDEIVFMYKGIVTLYQPGTEFEVVEKKIMPHDKKEWYKLKIHGCTEEGFSNPNDFEVLE